MYISLRAANACLVMPPGMRCKPLPCVVLPLAWGYAVAGCQGKRKGCAAATAATLCRVQDRRAGMYSSLAQGGQVASCSKGCTQPSACRHVCARHDAPHSPSQLRSASSARRRHMLQCRGLHKTTVQGTQRTRQQLCICTHRSHRLAPHTMFVTPWTWATAAMALHCSRCCRQRWPAGCCE